MSLPAVANALESKGTDSRFITEFGLADTVAYENVSTTISKSVIGASNTVSPREPWVACALSILAPGLGQFYNGQSIKGCIHLGLAVGGYTMFFLSVADNVEFTDAAVLDVAGENVNVNDMSVLDVDGDDLRGGLGLLVGLGVSVWSIIDAPTSAKKINKRNQMQAHLDYKDGYAVSPIVKRNKVGATVAFQF